MEQWQEFSIEVNREVQEALSHHLIEEGAQGVSIQDWEDYKTYPERFGELFPQAPQSDRIRVTAYYSQDRDLDQIETQVRHVLDDLASYGLEVGEVEIAKQTLDQEDWAENWKKYYEPARISHDLTIVPSWTDYEPSPGEKVIRLDPGMAFGTGTHPTTKLSLYALEQVLRGGESVIDVGTGSGVLSIAAALLGAGSIRAFDLDEVAVRVARENIALNPHMESIQVGVGNLLEGVGGQVQVIVANILADVLVLLLEDAYTLLEAEGSLILSGIIADKWSMVEEAALAAGFVLERRLIEGEWNACILRKTDNPQGIIGG